ncbi:MAG: ABC-2 family transporter protein [Thermomicrobiales bacterium]
MTYLRLFWIHLRLGVLNELQYRANLGVQLLQSLVGLATSLLGLGIIFSKTDTLAGWLPAELLVVVGVFMIVSGLTQMIMRPSLTRFMEDVRLGTLDFVLTKPVDAQALVSMRQVEIWKLIDVFVGLVVLVVAMSQLGATIGVQEALFFLLALTCGVVIIYSFLVILATFAFWFVKLDNILNIFQSMYEAGRWPITIYPPWLRAALTFIVPVGFAVTVPSEGLVGRPSLQLIGGAVALAIVLPLIARAFWRYGIRHYSGASA